MLTIVAFIVALGLLIAVHEYGHYRVAVACGVKVLRFSIGFGKTLYRWQPKKQRPGQATEFAIGAFPLGGYVRMLDEREGPVAPEERQYAFNTQSTKARAAIVVAGPLANLLLAVVLHTGVNWYGVQEPKAILSSPVPGSMAERAGLHGGERIAQAGFDGESSRPLRSFEDLRWLITRGAINGRDVRLELADIGGSTGRDVVLPLSRFKAREADASLFRKIGIVTPWTPPVIGEVVAGGAGARAGLHKGDLVISVAQQPIVDGQQLRELIRSGVQQGRAQPAAWSVRRGEQTLQLLVQPDVVQAGPFKIGRISAYVGAPAESALVRYGLVEGVWKSLQRTWEVSVLTLRMMGRMVVGQASLKNLSGPLTIADYAGKSASLGLIQYLEFLALISISLGVLNLLPLPVLDGGHLMYYLWEAVTGKRVSDIWMERLQRGGAGVLLVVMSIALFNDLTRLFG